MTEACLFSEVARTMQKNDRSGDDSQRDSVSEHPLCLFPFYILSSLFSFFCAKSCWVCGSPDSVFMGSMNMKVVTQLIIEGLDNSQVHTSLGLSGDTGWKPPPNVTHLENVR